MRINHIRTIWANKSQIADLLCIDGVIEKQESITDYGYPLFVKAWNKARVQAESSFSAHEEKVVAPHDCPYTIDQVMNSGFVPGYTPEGVLSH